MNFVCPQCSREATVGDISPATMIAVCPGCQTSFSFLEKAHLELHLERC